MAAAAFIVARSCGYEFSTVVGYFGYFALYVALPGIVTTYLVKRAPLSIAQAIALGLPTGFAVEIFSYLGLAAADAKGVYLWTPLGWLGLVFAIRRAGKKWPVRVRL